MKLHLVILLLLFSATSFAQYSLTASIGVGTADAGLKDAGLFNSVDITNYRSLTGGITFLQDVSRTIKIGAALSFQQYIIKSMGGGSTGFFNSGDRIELDENDAYLFLGPVLNIRIFKFLYLDIEPSVGILLKGNETYGIGDPPAFSTADGVQRSVFQIGIGLKEPIRVYESLENNIERSLWYYARHIKHHRGV